MKMKVNILNYEVWMIDYFDGKLNADETNELMAFIEEHQKIKEEFETFVNIGIEPVDAKYDAKEKLKKNPVIASPNINEENYEEYFIAYFEGDLSANEQTDVMAFVDANPALKKEFEIHNKLFLHDSPVIVYTDKAGLKRKAAIAINWQIAGVAAAILILFGLFNLFDTGNSVTPDRSENNKNLPELQSKTIVADLKRNEAVTIIKKSAQYAETTIANNVISRSELIVLNALPSQSPDLKISHSIGYPDLMEYKTEYSDLTNALASVNKPKRKNAFGRVIQNLSRKLTINIPEREVANENDPTFVKALGRTINVFNTLTGSDTELVKAYDQNGKLTQYYVEGETIAWSRNIVANNE